MDGAGVYYVTFPLLIVPDLLIASKARGPFTHWYHHTFLQEPEHAEAEA